MEGYKVGASNVYQTYKNWCINNGHYVMSGTKFGIEFSKKYNKTTIKGKKFYKDISIRDVDTMSIGVESCKTFTTIEI